MSPKTQTYLISSWSGRVLKARKNHRCALCGGTIVSGTMYHRDVVRDGPNKGLDPIRNIHSHLNCHTPWWQPGDQPDRLRYVGQLPRRQPTTAEHPSTAPFVKPIVTLSDEAYGTFTWKLPADLEARLGLCLNEHRKMGAIGELEHSLAMVLTAIVATASNKRKARELSIKLNAITLCL